MVSTLTRLFVVLCVLALIALVGGVRGEETNSVLFAGSALLLAALFAGQTAANLGLPKLTGYLLIGIIVGPHVLKFIPAGGLPGLDLVKGLAVSLIALIAGTELELHLLRRVGTRVLAMCLVVSGIVFVASWGTVVALRPFLAFMNAMTWPQVAAVSALIASVVVSFSPTVTIAIVQESNARGPFTEFLMAFVIVGDLVVLIAFAIFAGVTRASFGGGLDPTGVLGGVAWELFGSLLGGVVLALGILLFVRKSAKEVPLFVTAVCFVSAEAGLKLHLSPLLLALAAGALIANVDEPTAHKVREAVKLASLPVFALFFAAAGASLHLEVLGVIGPLAVVLVAVRALSIYVSARRFGPAEIPHVRSRLWMGLISQAGVTFGLASLIARTFPGFGADVEVLIVAMVTIHELIGPVLVRRALTAAGEAQPVEGALRVPH